jgi:hypothetical protein
VLLGRFGSFVYQRFTDFYGPQFDIQEGFSHQGYGETADYRGFYGKGTQYIDLSMARIYDSAYNCTRGFQIMNETYAVNKYDFVFTDPVNDPAKTQRRIPRGGDVWYRGTCETGG